MVGLLLTSDLLNASQIEGAASRCGVALQVISDPKSLVKKCQELETLFVVVDLDCKDLDVAALLAQLKSLPIPPHKIIAFGAHVHEKRLDGARHAGCDEVFTRGRFHREAAKILQGFQSNPET